MNIKDEWVEAGVKAWQNCWGRKKIWDHISPSDSDLSFEAVQTILAAVLPLAVAEERERCANVAERGHCTYSGCDTQTTGHSNLCPLGIAATIREGDPS